MGDHWFVYGPRAYETGNAAEVDPDSFEAIAYEVVGYIEEQADTFWAQTPSGELSGGQRPDESPRN